MARTAVREQVWSVNGNMLHQGSKEMTSISTSRMSGRSTYKTRSLSRSQVIKRNVINENLDDQHSSLQCPEREVLYYSPNETRRTRNLVEQNDSFEQDNYLQNDSTDSLEEFNCSGYLLMWRKCLYFILSKPTHYDVEILSQMKAFGKKKVVLTILLPLLLYLLYSTFASKKNVINFADLSPMNALFSSTSDSDYNDPSSLTIGIIDHEDENLSSAPVDDYRKSSFSWSSFFSPLFSFTSAKNSHIASEHEVKSASNINMSEVEILIRRIILEDPDSLYFLHNNQKHDFDVQKKINELHTEFLSLQSEFKKFKENMNSNHNEELHVIKQVKENSEAHKLQLNEFDDKMHYTEEKLITLETSFNNLKNCCTNETKLISLIEHNTRLLLHSLMADQSGSSFPSFKEWLHSKFATKEMVEQLLINSITNTKDREKESEIAITEALKKHFETLVSKSSHISNTKENVMILQSNASEVEMLIRKAILLYDADKTGQTDYALESGGGSIVNTRCSETYTEHSARISILGFPLWHLQNSPRNAIQPSVHPGECWAFKGSQGYLVIQLATIIKPTGFVVEHIPKSISSSGNIDSAPKDFSVHGLLSEKDFEGELLGKYSYNKDGDPLQYFPIQAENVLPYRFIELKIHSNHGNGNYTCLYRFRVHGLRH